MNHHHPIISFQAVSKTYGEDPLDYKALILKNVHLDIYPNEFVIIFGPSGSGKSSLLNLMAGLEFATAGRILFRRRDLSHFTNPELSRYHRLKMGMVFQTFNLIKSLNVWENVALPQAANGIRYDRRRKRALHILKLLNLERYADRHPNEVSGGEQQRVAIARALINNPYFLLVDEPTGNLDSESAKEVMDIFYGLNRHGKHTIVLVTHNPEYLQYASRVIYLQDGKVVKQESRDTHGQITKTEPVSQTQFKKLGDFRDDVKQNPHDKEPDAKLPAPASPKSQSEPELASTPPSLPTPQAAAGSATVIDQGKPA